MLVWRGEVIPESCDRTNRCIAAEIMDPGHGALDAKYTVEVACALAKRATALGLGKAILLDEDHRVI